MCPTHYVPTLCPDQRKCVSVCPRTEEIGLFSAKTVRMFIFAILRLFFRLSPFCFWNVVLAASSPRFSAPETMPNTPEIILLPTAWRMKALMRCISTTIRRFLKKTCFWGWKGAGSRTKQGPGNKDKNVPRNLQKTSAKILNAKILRREFRTAGGARQLRG